MVRRKIISWLLFAGMIAGILTGCSGEKTESVGEPVSITIWNYYNGDQLDAFNDRVALFNETVGAEQDIFVESYSHGSITDLKNNLRDSAEEKAGASELPNIFSAYADTAYEMDELGLVEDLRDYLTEEEWSAYMEHYLKEGDFSGDGEVKIFPIVKSTELLFLNETDWEIFAEATGVSYAELRTVEGLINTAKIYYEWTDAMTPEPGDGQAFFGRDAMSNYFLIGAKQLGCIIFQVEDGKMTLDFDKTVVRKLWNSYYVPFVKGYFGASGRFRSDDIKIGNIIGYQGSTTSLFYFPTQVINGEKDPYEITLKVLPAPVFYEGQEVAVQQGAGMAVTKGTEDEIRASVTFLKWFAEPENNIKFSVDSGYLPVTKQANTMEQMEEADMEMSDSVKELLTTALETVNTCELYTPLPFEDGQSARQVLEYCLSDQAIQDRELVEERIAQGMDPQEAMAEFLTGAAFDSWYEKTCEALKAFEN